MALIRRLKPRWLFCSPPCTAHCPLQTLNAYKNKANWWRLMAKRKKARAIYKSCVSYCREVVEKQKGEAMWETGARAFTWQEHCLQPLMKQFWPVIFDQCAYGCVHPKNGRPVQKKTKIISSSIKVRQLADYAVARYLMIMQREEHQ